VRRVALRNTMNNNIIDSLNWRYAVKSFDPARKVPQADLNILMEALRLTPSSFGLQPWRFVVISNLEIKAKLYPVSWGNKQVNDCSHLIVLCAPNEFGDANVDDYLRRYRKLSQKSEELNLGAFEMTMKKFLAGMSSDDVAHWMDQQVHIALGVLLSAAATVGIDSCPMGGFLPKEYDRILDLDSQGLRSVTLCALGYRSPQDLSAQRSKVRFEEKEIFSFLT